MSKVKLFSNPTNSVRLTLSNADQRNVSFLDFIKESCPSLYGEKAVYHPTSYLFNGHLQTGFAAYYKKSPTTKEVVYERELIDTPDGGCLALDWCPSKQVDSSNKETPTLVVLHGLTGGSHESYIRSLLEVVTFPPFNYRAVVMNSRGCANSDIKTPQMYSGGYTDDLRVALPHIQDKLGKDTPLVGIGFSLGSNILIKYLGEEKEKAPFKAGISVGNPFDFERSMGQLDESYIGRKVYSAAMANNLKNAFGKHSEILAQGGKVNPEEVMAAQTIQDFDEACTRKMFDFASVSQYYHDASSYRFIEHVKVPLLCINALDDPIAAARCIPYKEIETNPNVVLATTDTGGHLGWFEHTRNPTRWVVKPLTEFIVSIFQAYDIRATQGKKMDADAIDDRVDEIQSQAEHHQIA